MHLVTDKARNIKERHWKPKKIEVTPGIEPGAFSDLHSHVKET